MSRNFVVKENEAQFTPVLLATWQSPISVRSPEIWNACSPHADFGPFVTATCVSTVNSSSATQDLKPAPFFTRGVTLTPRPLLVPWSRKSRAIPLLSLWAARPVQSLSACTMVRFTLHFTFLQPSQEPVYLSTVK